ncbi:MAG: hypothetical protein UW99_C0045G0003 [Candidatus Collierbacteria bacterium GW2011_GWC2_45_15]|uniref:Uncharacterized protein n=1 Tax=Candidatus Collierbacteria bacterium GW2011_GWC2_45_15 TaxID=1618394 RepID=A0A0G1PKU9_9BACT|nr:MAG: hypothetical protein UW99_C0045G0003 [Candidatus Collierbacteria bacterium GW2011_GWC2_45_15]
MKTISGLEGLGEVLGETLGETLGDTEASGRGTNSTRSSGA